MTDPGPGGDKGWYQPHGPAYPKLRARALQLSDKSGLLPPPTTSNYTTIHNYSLQDISARFQPLKSPISTRTSTCISIPSSLSNATPAATSHQHHQVPSPSSKFSPALQSYLLSRNSSFDKYPPPSAPNPPTPAPPAFFFFYFSKIYADVETTSPTLLSLHLTYICICTPYLS